MAKRLGFFAILGFLTVFVSTAEAGKTKPVVTKSVSASEGLAVGGYLPLGECYGVQSGVNMRETDTVEGKIKNLTQNTFAQLTFYYTCGGSFEIVFELSGNDDGESDFRIADDGRTATFRKTMSILKDGYPYTIDIVVAIIADGDPFFGDNAYKFWNGSKTFQSAAHAKSVFRSGQAFGTISLGGYNYLDNAWGYIFSESSSTVTTSK